MDSSYLPLLSQEIASKDPYRVNAIIVEGSTLFSNALIQLYDIYGDTTSFNAYNDLTEDIGNMSFQTDTELIDYLRERFQNIESSERGQYLCLVVGWIVAVYAGVVVDAGVAVNVAVAIDVYAVVALWGPFLDTPISQGGNSNIGISANHSLQRELFVREICEMPISN